MPYPTGGSEAEPIFSTQHKKRKTTQHEKLKMIPQFINVKGRMQRSHLILYHTINVNHIVAIADAHQATYASVMILSCASGFNQGPMEFYCDECRDAVQDLIGQINKGTGMPR